MRTDAHLLRPFAAIVTAVLLSAATRAQELSPNEIQVLARLDAMLQVNVRCQIRSNESFDLTVSSLNQRTRVVTERLADGREAIRAERGGGGASLNSGTTRSGAVRDGGAFHCWVTRRTEPLTEEELQNLLPDEETDQLLQDVFRAATNEHWSYTVVDKQDVDGTRRYHLRYQFLGMPTDTLDSKTPVDVDRYVGVVTDWHYIPGGRPSQLTMSGERLSGQYLRTVATNVYASIEPFQNARLVHARFQMGVPDASRAQHQAMTQYHRNCVDAGELTVTYILTYAHSARDSLRQSVVVDAFTGQPIGLSRYDFDGGSRGSDSEANDLLAPIVSTLFTCDLRSPKPSLASYGRVSEEAAPESLPSGTSVVMRDREGALCLFQYDTRSQILWREESGLKRCWKPNKRLTTQLDEYVTSAAARKASIPSSFFGNAGG